MRKVIALALVYLAVPAFGCGAPGEPSNCWEDRLSAREKEEVRQHAKRFTSQIRAEIADGRMDTLAKKTDQAIENLVHRGLEKLSAAGDLEGAHFHEFLFRTEMRGYLTRMVAARSGGYDIGDHRPLSAWLATFYSRLEFILGIEACKSLHLSDIKSLNYGIPVVFNPCTFPMDTVEGLREDEYERHFAEGEIYYGVVPVVSYWLVDAPCMVLTSGIAAILCGPIASGVEFSVAKFVAPKLSDWVFKQACN